ncbi:MAG: molybdopterin biosynthesis protein MoeA [Rhodospirillales bacterium]|nr:molybdopterin biosynthesis protein MoeA [Rhodospirillales bacterium]
MNPVPRPVDFDECFRTDAERHTVAEAVARFESRLGPIARVERVATREALGRILAQDLVAERDIPPHDNSAMDGYAVYFDDLTPGGETRLPVVARVAAGHPHPQPIARGHAVQIFTGAPMPEGPGGRGPDTVFMAEDCKTGDGFVTLPPGIAQGANRRRAGEDVKRGDVVLRQGLRLRPQDSGMIASLGFADVAVYRRLRVAVFSTGDEVREPGDALAPGGIFDANRYTTMAMFERLGCAVTDLGILPDQVALIRAAIAAAAEGHDLLLTSGGVSLGEEDRVREAVAHLGSVNFWSLAMKPGRVVALGHVHAGSHMVPFIGLPGNPVAVMVTFVTIARPIVLRLAGAVPSAPVAFRVVAGFDFVKKAGRREWLRAHLVAGADGPIAQKFSDDGSGILSSMVETDGLIELAEDVTGVARGDRVDFLPYGELMG